MIRKLFYGGLLLAVLLLAAGGVTAAPAELRDIHVQRENDSTRIVLELTSQTTHELFTLDKPDRVVIDLRDTRIASGVRMPKGEGIVTGVRAGERPKQTLRVVIELQSSKPARATWSDAENGARKRLVIDLGDPGARQTATADAAGEVETEAPLRAVREAHKPGQPARDVVIAIDAGHGGKDPGAIGPTGAREKDVVLGIAKALAQRIDREPGMKAVLTRDTDVYLTLRERIRRARAAQADMFISVHADSIRNRDVSGASVYILSERGATSEAARWLAERENAADLVGGVSLSDKDDVLASVLLDLSQTASITASMSAAERVLGALNRVGEVRKPLVQQAGFLVLKSPDIPSLLIETAYISNPSEERRLRSGGHQAKLAEAIFRGVRDYFQDYPPPGTRFAQARRASPAGVLASPAGP